MGETKQWNFLAEETMDKKKTLSANALRSEVNKERWDRNRIPVRVRLEDGTEYEVTGFAADRDVLVLEAQSVESYGTPQPEEGELPKAA